MSTKMYSQTLALVLRLEIDFVLSLSQEQEEQPPPKSFRKMYTIGLEFGTET